VIELQLYSDSGQINYTVFCLSCTIFTPTHASPAYKMTPTIHHLQHLGKYLYKTCVNFLCNYKETPNIKWWTQKKKSWLQVIPVHAMTAYKGSGCIAPLILNLSTGWRWAVSFMPCLLYSQGNGPTTLWIWGCVASRASSDFQGNGKSLPPAGIWTMDYLTYGLVIVLTTLSQLQIFIFHFHEYGTLIK
jgi:hypothetical protein